MSKDEEEQVKQSTSFSSSVDFNPCPICLSPPVNESFLDICFHKFCYNCIVQWTRVVQGKNSHKLASVKCPLCKVENFSMVHGFDGISFQKHYINQDLENGFVFSKEHKYRLQCYYTEPGVFSDIFNVTHYWKSQKYLHPNRWLRSWLQREIQALIQEEDVDIIVHHIHGVIDSFLTRCKQSLKGKMEEAKREEFKSLISEAARSFLAARTERFVGEVELFLSSGLNIEAYDSVCKQRLRLNRPDLWSIEAEEAIGVCQRASIIPYLYVFDEDSDGTD